MLAGHEAIRVIHLTDHNSPGNSAWRWPQGSLGSLHATLEEFTLQETQVPVGDALLMEAACCSKLRSVDVGYECSSSGCFPSETGLWARAAGRCRC
jgi:hypothetical protein